MSRHDPFAPARARRNGLLTFLISLGIFASGIVVAWVLVHFTAHELNVHELAILALPGAWALAGLIEFITEVPFVELASRWDALKGWQRGVFGTFIVVIALLIIVTAVALFVS